VPILNQLDDTTVLAILNKMEDDQVAKILAAFDANRSAQLTQAMFKGPNPNQPATIFGTN
jgi:flagellar motility protein MotE (MotC chaperone)